MISERLQVKTLYMCKNFTHNKMMSKKFSRLGFGYFIRYGIISFNKGIIHVEAFKIQSVSLKME